MGYSYCDICGKIHSDELKGCKPSLPASYDIAKAVEDRIKRRQLYNDIIDKTKSW